MRPFSTSDISVAQFIPGAEGLRSCHTNQGPILLRVACRVAWVFSMPHCRQAPALESLTHPQKGQTACEDTVRRAVAGVPTAVASPSTARSASLFN